MEYGQWNSRTEPYRQSQDLRLGTMSPAWAILLVLDIGHEAHVWGSSDSAPSVNRAGLFSPRCAWTRGFRGHFNPEPVRRSYH